MIAACFGGGPSLTAADVAACQGLDYTIAINDAVTLAPWASAVLGGELKWWRWFKGCPDFQGRKYSCHSEVPKVYPDVTRLIPTGLDGCEWTPGHVRTGGNSGYVAIQMAAQQGATTILLLGYDMQPAEQHHWHGEHPDGSHPNYVLCAPRFESLVGPLAERGVTVINCSRRSALRAFPCQPLAAVLSQR